MTESDARAYLNAIGYVPGQNNTLDPAFKSDADIIKQACRVIHEADVAKAAGSAAEQARAEAAARDARVQAAIAAAKAKG